MSANIKQYRISEQFGDRFEVKLEVDHDKLTPARAEEHLRFWTSADDHIAEANGNVVLAAIRSFGCEAIYNMLGDMGVDFSGGWHAENWSEKMRDIEGFGGEDGTPYGWIGIRILSAQAQSPSFEELDVKEINQ